MPVYRFSGLYNNYPQILELTLAQSHLAEEYSKQFSTAIAFHIAIIFVSPDTHDQHLDSRTQDP